VHYKIRKSKHHFVPPWLKVTFQSALRHVADLRLICLRAVWKVTLCQEGPQWYLLFLEKIKILNVGRG